MFKSLIYHLLKGRHFWRYASFSEIAEIYISRTIRVIAMNIVSGFTSVYLYEEGYSFMFIIGLWACYYLLRMPLSFLAGNFVAYFGPKHGMLASSLLYVPGMVAIGFMTNAGIISIVLWGFFMALSASIYNISYLVDFSKVKNVDNAGKELAYMNILEKIAIGISPVIGGAIAFFFGLQIVIWVAVVMFTLSSLPLMMTVEPVLICQKMSSKGFPWRAALSSIFAQTGIGFDYMTTGVVWSLFIVIVIFPEAGWDVYLKLGILSSVTILVAILTSYAYGKLIDKSRGGDLLKISVLANSMVHLSRIFVSNPLSIVMTNITNEVATIGYSMAYTRGMFDTADLSGRRIFYLCICDIVACFGAVIACFILLICSTMLGDIGGLKVFFVFAAAFVLLIGTANFRLYRQ